MVCSNYAVLWANDTKDGDGSSPSLPSGFLYAALFSLATMFVAPLQNSTMNHGVRHGVSASAATSMAIFDHVLRLPVASTLKSTTGI